MNLYAKITTDTGKVIGKGANKFLKLEVLDKEQNIIFERTITADDTMRKCFNCLCFTAEKTKLGDYHCYKCGIYSKENKRQY